MPEKETTTAKPSGKTKKKKRPKSELIDKVEKLIRLAEGNANANEGRTAAIQAAKLALEVAKKSETTATNGTNGNGHAVMSPQEQKQAEFRQQLKGGVIGFIIAQALKNGLKFG